MSSSSGPGLFSEGVDTRQRVSKHGSLQRVDLVGSHIRVPRRTLGPKGVWIVMFIPYEMERRTKHIRVETSPTKCILKV